MMLIQKCNIPRRDAEDAEAQKVWLSGSSLRSLRLCVSARGLSARIKRASRLLSLCLILICAFASQLETRSLAQSQNDSVLPAPKDGLVDLHLPDLENLEPGVREHILSFQKSLADLCKAPATTDEKLSEAYGLMGQIYQAYSLYSPAEECYLNAHRLERRDFRWIYLLANLYQQENRAEESITHYKSARALRPDYLAASVNLGNLYLQQNLLNDARASFHVALGLDAKSAAALYGLGQVALSTRNYGEAAKYLEEALSLVPEANRIHYALAMAYRGLGKTEEAQSHLARQGQVGIRALDPLVDDLQKLIQGERVHLLRGRLAFEARRYAEAAEEFRKAIAAKPDSIPARVNLGSSLAQAGDINGAIELFKEALRLDPRNQAAHYNLGFLLAKQNRPEQAITHLRFTVETNAKDAEARHLLVQQLLRAGRVEESLTEFSHLVESNPDNEDALLEQVNLLMKVKRYRQALESLDRGYRLFPKKGRTAAALAYLLAASPQYDLRDGARALDLARLVYQTTASISHGAIMAMAMAEMGRCTEAIEWQRRMIAAARQENKPDMVEKLRADLRHYETANPCRPAGHTAPSESGRQ